MLLYLAVWLVQKTRATLSTNHFIQSFESPRRSHLFSWSEVEPQSFRAITLCFLALYQAIASFREWHGCFNRWKGMAIFYVYPCRFIVTLFFGKTNMREGYVRLLTRSSTLCSTYHTDSLSIDDYLCYFISFSSGISIPFPCHQRQY